MKNRTLNLIPLISLVLFFALSGCQEAKEPEKLSGPEYSKKIKSIIDANNAQIVKWYAAGEIDSVASFFSEDCIQMPPNQMPIIGNDSFIAAWSQNMQFGEWKFDLKAVKVKASGNLATELGRYSLEFIPNEESPIPAMTDKGSYIVLWEKINDNWKIVWDAPVSELPMEH